jgi:hypothetical protein
MLDSLERGVRRAWLLLCGALALHVLDEALTGFLDVYNPTVRALRAQMTWLPLPVFTFPAWLGGLIVAVVVLVGLTPFVAGRSRAWRAFAYFVSVVMLFNGVGHIAGTIAGRTVATVRFSRPMPGFYSAPLLLVTSVLVMVRLQRSRGHTDSRDITRLRSAGPAPSGEGE